MGFLFICALINVHASESSLCACISVAMHAGVVRWSNWYGAEVTGIVSPGQMGRDAFAQEVAEKCAFLPLVLFLTHSVTLSIALSICLSLPAFPYSLSHSLTPSNQLTQLNLAVFQGLSSLS